MKIRSLLLLMALTVLFSTSSNAQLGNLRKSINKAINKQIDNKIDTAVDKSIKDSRTNSGQNEQSDQNQSGNATEQNTQGTLGSGRGLFGGKIDIKYNEEYSFTGRIYMQMEAYDKKDVVKSDYYTYFNNNTLNAGIEVKITNSKEGESVMPTVFLFDGDNRSFMMLLENKDSKTGIISSIPSDSTIAAQAKAQKGEVPAKPTITKTGNSKTIAGYKCDEYKIVEQGKDGYSLVWMTKDVKLKAEKKYWGKAGIPTYNNYPGLEGAMMLAMEGYDKNNQIAMKLETKEINENFTHKISTAGYTFMKMNFGQTGKK
jgi:hypothetical protein